MKRLIFIIIIFNTIPILFGQTNIENVWLTKYNGDSLIQERFFSQLNIETKDYRARILFDPSGDTTEIVITYQDKNGNDSLEIWKYSNDSASFTLHWQYNENNQLVTHYTTMGSQSNNDTIIYEYDKSGQLIKETRLYENYFMFDSSIYRNGKIIIKIRKDPDQILNRKEYKYDKNGQITRILSLTENREIGEKISYKYDSKNRLSKFKIIRYKTDFAPNHIVIFKKFKYNNSDKIIEYNEINNNINTSRTYHYEYDTSGEKTKTIILDNYNEKKFIYEYERKTLYNSK